MTHRDWQLESPVPRDHTTCPTGQICDPTALTCRNCASSSECPSATPNCEAGLCSKPCTSDADCPLDRVCNTSEGRCTGCTITAQSTVSTAIPTVAIVTFTTNLTSIDRAEIQFGLAGRAPMVAPVDLAVASYRTLLLGMKGNRQYVYRIVARSGARTCTSADYGVQTGTVPSNVPRPALTVMNQAAHAPGFIVTSGGVTVGNVKSAAPVYILDSDGEPVWWAAAPAGTSRALMSWDGKEMWMVALDIQNDGGEVRKVLMDGTGAMNNIAGLSAAHHDLTVLPDGSIATLLWNGGGADAPNSLVERAPDGTIKTIVADLATLYNSSGGFHTNAIHYYPADNSYTLSDGNLNLHVKVTRAGQLVWQLGGSNPRGQAFTLSGGTWNVNHGHHYLADGTFLMFRNGALTGGTSYVYAYRLDTTAWTATRTWTYQAGGVNSPILSDVQRLPNGNTLVTYSTAGTIQEVDSSGRLVVSLETNTVGYAEFRTSLYGPPLR